MSPVCFSRYIRFFFTALCVCAVAFMLSECSSKKAVRVDRKEYKYGGSFTTDTLKIIATKSDVSWKVTSDQFWVLVDSQIQLGTKEDFLFNVLDNPDTVQREAKIFITGQDIDTITLVVTQDKGMAVPAKEASENTRHSVHKRVIIEEEPVEDVSVSDVPGEQTVTSGGSAGKSGGVEASEDSAASEAKPTKQDAQRLKMELSADETILGAAKDLESSPITLDANGAWSLNAKTLPQWLEMLGVDDKPLKQGKGKMNFKLRTKDANTTLNSREGVLEFQMGKLIKTLKVVQKPTESSLTLDPATLKIPGEPDDAPLIVKIKALNTQWEIKSEIPAWLKINKMSGGAGDAEITVSATVNDLATPREAKILFVSTGEVIKKEFVITQEIQSVKISVTTPEPLANKAESFVTFVVNSTAEWKIIKKEDVTWYDLDVTTGTGGEDNPETVTVTALENNPEMDRTDTIVVMSNNVKRKVVIIQRGTKLKPINLSVSSADTLDFDKDLQDGQNYPISITCNDKWLVKGLPSWLVAVNAATKAPLTAGFGNDKIELKLANPKDSIRPNKLQYFTIQSDVDPNVKKTIFIKSKSAIVKKEITVTGLAAGTYIPYLEIGNISKAKATTANPTTAPSSVSISVYSSVDFVLKEDQGKNNSLPTFFTVKIDKENYVLGDVIPAGNHEITINAQEDNISEENKSKVKILNFLVDGQMMAFKDLSNNKDEVLQFEVKQEAFILDSDKPKILVDDISFNGYNSYVLLGNPSVKKVEGDTNKYEAPKKVIRIKTDKPIKISMVEDQSPFFSMYYGSSATKTNNSYKLGKIIPPGEYYFSFESKKNYTDPNGFKSKATQTLFFEMGVEKAKSKKDAEEEQNAEVQPNLIFIDIKNRDYTGLHFRTEFLVEQESL